MPRLWRYKRDGQECGPVTGDDLKMLAKSQRLGPTDLVCKEGTNHWFPARGIRGLFPRPGLFGKFVGWFGTTGCVIALLAVVAVGVGVGFIIYAIHNANIPAPSPPPEVHHHTRLLNALHEMKQARSEMQGAGHDFGGHRDFVSKSLDDAIAQTEKALKAAGVNVDEATDDPDADKKYHDHPHPHLDRARDEIIAAETEIKGSKDDLGGERELTLAKLAFVKEQLKTAQENADK